MPLPPGSENNTKHPFPRATPRPSSNHQNVQRKDNVWTKPGERGQSRSDDQTPPSSTAIIQRRVSEASRNQRYTPEFLPSIPASSSRGNSTPGIPPASSLRQPLSANFPRQRLLHARRFFRDVCYCLRPRFRAFPPPPAAPAPRCPPSRATPLRSILLEPMGRLLNVG